MTLSLITFAASSLAIVSPGTVTLTDRDVHVADVVAGAAALPVAARRVVLARLPDGVGRLDLSRAALASLVRRGLPGAAVSDHVLAGRVTFLVAPPAAAPRAARAFVPPVRPVIARGDALRLTSVAGPVRVVRPVTALQSSRGHRVFVRDADGAVFAVRVARVEDAR